MNVYIMHRSKPMSRCRHACPINIHLTPKQHIDLAERWGSINVNRFFKPLEGYPKIAQVIKEADQKENIGGL